MKYLYSEGSILHSSSGVIRFTKDETVKLVSVNFDTNYRMYEVKYSKSARYRDLPPVIRTMIDDSDINVVGDLFLYPRTVINGLTFYLKGQYKQPNRCIFSSFIDADCKDIVYEENDNGFYLIFPKDFHLIENRTERVKELINNGTKAYVTGDKFLVSNILSIDLLEDKTYPEFRDFIPYSTYPHLYLTEADIISSFIRKCKLEFPEIEFFPFSPKRDNKGKESIYYRSFVSQERSSRFNSNIVKSDLFERMVQTTIPLELIYQTSDIRSYVNRRDSYLLYRFLMKIRDFDVEIDSGIVDRYGNSMDKFNFAVYWDKSSVQNELSKQDSYDGSGRDTYSLTMNCDLICYILESRNKPSKLLSIIRNIYF